MSTSTNVTLALACLAASAVFAAPASAADNVSAAAMPAIAQPAPVPPPPPNVGRPGAPGKPPAPRAAQCGGPGPRGRRRPAGGPPRDRSPMARAAARARLLHRAAARARLLHPDAARRAPRRRCRTCAARSRPTAESGLARGLQNRSRWFLEIRGLGARPPQRSPWSRSAPRRRRRLLAGRCRPCPTASSSRSMRRELASDLRANRSRPRRIVDSWAPRAPTSRDRSPRSRWDRSSRPISTRRRATTSRPRSICARSLRRTALGTAGWPRRRSPGPGGRPDRPGRPGQLATVTHQPWRISRERSTACRRRSRPSRTSVRLPAASSGS